MGSRIFLPVIAGTILILTLFFAATAGAQEDTTEETTEETTSTADATADAAAEDADGAADRDGSFRCDSFLRVVRDEDGTLRRQYRDGDDELIVQRFEQCLEADVLRNTIPNKLLPDTGGAPLLGLAAIGLASLVAGASLLGAVTRRRR